MQRSHVTAFWLRLAGNIPVDLFLHVHRFRPSALPLRGQDYTMLNLSPLARAALAVEVSRPRGRPPSRCCVETLQNSRSLEMCKAPVSVQRSWSPCASSRVHFPERSGLKPEPLGPKAAIWKQRFADPPRAPACLSAGAQRWRLISRTCMSGTRSPNRCRARTRRAAKT
jgi:hypothetical protein